MKNSVRQLLLIIIVLALLLSGCSGAPDRGQTASGSAAAPLADLCVYGEHALLWLEEREHGQTGGWLRHLTLHYQAPDGQETDAPADQEVICGEAVNQGLCLYQLAAGSYTFSTEEGRISASADLSPLEGYTLPRGGQRLHWQFAAQEGLLTLTIEEVAVLPEGWYDIFIDVGHGGEDSGAASDGYIEAEENLRAARYLQELLEQRGFRVLLSRTDMSIPGGPAAEDNPYLAGARVDAVYASGASYLISNHLNAGAGRESGFQLYTSVLTDGSWAEAIAERFAARRWYANNSNLGRVGNGLYQRWARDNYHTGRDYYFILRETGGAALAPHRYQVHNNTTPERLRRGAEGILIEYLFLDNRADRAYWELHYRELVEAAVDGCLIYWQAGE